MRTTQLFISLAILTSVGSSCSNSDPQTINTKKAQELASNENINHEYIENYHNDSLRSSLVSLVLAKGDTTAYNDLYQNYTMSGHEREFLAYSFVMANKYDYAPAYYDVFRLSSFYDSGNVYLIKTKKMRHQYLLKAYFLKDKSSVYDVKAEFGSDTDQAKLKAYLNELERCNRQ